MCTPGGGIECDVTVTRLAEDRFYVVSAAAGESHDEAWLRGAPPRARRGRARRQRHRPARRAHAGRSELARAACRRHRRRLRTGGVPVLQLAARSRSGWRRSRAMRVSFVGELGYELHHPLEYQRHIYEQLLGRRRAAWAGRLRLPGAGLDAAGEGLPDVGLGPVGAVHAARGRHAALGVLRQAVSSGATRWRTWPRMAGRTAAWSAWSSTPTVPTRMASSRYATARRLSASSPPAATASASTARSRSAYLPRGYSRTGTRLTVEILGHRRTAEVVRAPLYDPTNELLTG